MIAKVLEAIMLILFGISWPFNLMKSIKTRSTKGKSLLFLVLIEVGYMLVLHPSSFLNLLFGKLTGGCSQFM